MVIVTGANGRLGTLVQEKMEATGLDLENADIEADITNDEVKEKIREVNPDTIIHLAAIHAGECEENPAKCRAVNVFGTRNIVEIAEEIDAHVVFLSSSHIFSGKNSDTYTEQSEPDPVLRYGEAKLEAENAVRQLESYTILRSAIMYGEGGSEASSGNFFSWVKSELAEDNEVDVIMDQVNSPAYMPNVAEAIKEATDKRINGTYNVASPEYLSRYTAVKRLKEIFDLSGSINPIDREELGWEDRGYDYSMDVSKFKKDFETKPTTFNDGLLKWKERMKQ